MRAKTRLAISFAVVAVSGFIIQMKARKESMAEERDRLNGHISYCAPTLDLSKLNQPGAPLIKGLGDTHYKITTKSKKAQKYFDQGLALTYGFNHGEAARSFKEAARLDSTCAMAYWGLAFVLGPNYNTPLNPTSLDDINEAIRKAVKYSITASSNEKALIQALAFRFPKQPVDDVTSYSNAYADAMKKAYESFPSDLQIATLYADALMNQHPWDLWKKDGTAQPWTPAIIELLEKILAKNKKFPGAIHYYIHATEASMDASRALPYTDILENAMPAAGHLVHMPSHTYIRTGDYHKGVIVNEKASAADSTYISQCKAQGAVPLLYYPHNIHFLAACAFLEGNSQKALYAAWSIAHKTDKVQIYEMPTVQHFFSIPYYVMVHLGKWDDILKLQAPDTKLKYPTAIYHYARGMALTAKKDFKEARKELDKVEELKDDKDLKDKRIWDMNPVTEVISIAANVLKAEIAAANNQYDEAISLLEKAVITEDNLMYQEPPDWFFSVRHTLGHVLNQAGRYAEAEKVYREDLKTLPENGWALMGLYNSLDKQGKTEEARLMKKRFDAAWAHADITITSSRVF
jgi:tetratricopeptide (TPR) repeat protein